jgi:transcription elongation factor Elf1
MRCPRCDNQGTVVKAKIKKTNEIVRICDECDALWPLGVAVELKSFVDFSTFVKPLGLFGLWNEIEIQFEENA